MDNTTLLGRGLSQAAHPDLKKLPLAARAIYGTLCGLLNVGVPRAISQRTIAYAAGVGEATVSDSMPILCEHGLVERSWDGSRYTLELLPLPEPPDPDERLAEIVQRQAEEDVRRRQGSIADPDAEDAEVRGSVADPGTDSMSTESIETPNLGNEAEEVSVGSAADPRTCMEDPRSHNRCTQQHTAHHKKILDELPVVGEAAWARMLAGTPGYNTIRFASDYKALIERGKTPFQAVGLIVWARSEGSPIWTASQLDQRAQGYHARLHPEGARALTPSHNPPRRWAQRQQPETGRNDPLDLERVKDRRKLAEQLLPPDADLDLRLAFFAGLDDGLDGQAALARALGKRGEKSDG